MMDHIASLADLTRELPFSLQGNNLAPF